MNTLFRPTLFTLLFTAVALAPVHAAATGPIDISAQKLEVNQSSSKAVFSGNVVVTQEGLTLNAPTVTADYASQGSSGIKTVTAAGGVTITRNGANGVTEKATGSTAVYRKPATLPSPVP